MTMKHKIGWAIVGAGAGFLLYDQGIALPQIESKLGTTTFDLVVLGVGLVLVFM